MKTSYAHDQQRMRAWLALGLPEPLSESEGCTSVKGDYARDSWMTQVAYLRAYVASPRTFPELPGQQRGPLNLEMNTRAHAHAHNPSEQNRGGKTGAG